MSQPKSLFQIVGAKLPTARWSTGVLLLIDHQMEYDVGGGLELPDVAQAKRELALLLSKARAKGTPVVHVAHHSAPGAPLFDPKGPNSAFMPELAPKDGEAVVIKSLANSFAKTTLDGELAKAGRKELIVAGFMTHNCVSSTVRASVEHGYRSTVVKNACATRDLPDPCGGVIPADVLHQVCLTGLADALALVVKSADDIED
jgi:nicotinamidase-related amidase